MNISVRVQAYVDSSHAGEQDESFPNVIFCSHSTVTMKNITKKKTLQKWEVQIVTLLYFLNPDLHQNDVVLSKEAGLDWVFKYFITSSGISEGIYIFLYLREECLFLQ